VKWYELLEIIVNMAAISTLIAFVVRETTLRCLRRYRMAQLRSGWPHPDEGKFNAHMYPPSFLAKRVAEALSLFDWVVRLCTNRKLHGSAPETEYARFRAPSTRLSRSSAYYLFGPPAGGDISYTSAYDEIGYTWPGSKTTSRLNMERRMLPENEFRRR